MIRLGFVALVLVCGFTARLTYEQMANFTTSAEAQSAQRLQPTEQGNGRYVFSGEGATDTTVKTTPFDIGTRQWTIISESDTDGAQPTALVATENGDIIATEQDLDASTARRFVETVDADPGRFTLEIIAVVENASWTVTVEEGTGAANETGDNPAQDQNENTTTAPKPQQDNGNDDLMNAGGPESGPVPLMPDGSCPAQYPVKKTGACYPS